MNLHEKIEAINSHKDLAVFIEALRSDLLSNPTDWENATLERFLDAAAAWVNSMEYAFKNMDKKFPESPSWKTVAEILYAAKIYE